MNALNETGNTLVSGFTLANFLQLINVEQKTCTLKVTSKNKTGYLHLIDGELVNAETNGVDGEEAATRIISWQNVLTEVQEIRRREKKVDTPLMNILLNSTCHADENEEARKDEDLLEEAVRLAEGRNFKKAKVLLIRILKHNKRNHVAWLWFSRVSANVQAIEGSLENARTLSPNDPEIKEEVRRFTRVKKRLAEGSYARCPFCWAPTEKDTISCLDCKCHISIHNGFFTSDHDGDRTVLDAAIKRYTRATSGEAKSARAHFWLAMAYLNAENYESALNHLDLSSKLSPTNPFYTKQLNILLKQVSSDGAIQSSGSALLEDHSKRKNIQPINEKNQKKILVVEDSPTIRKVVSITLRQKGFEIIEAGDGLEALSRLSEDKPALILLDIILPKMDGYKILSIIKENQDLKDIPVIMLTSKDGIFNKMKGKVAGSSAYLTKPFDPSKLLETVERYIKR